MSHQGEQREGGRKERFWHLVNTGQARCSITYNGRNSLCNKELPGLTYQEYWGSETLAEKTEAAKVENQCPLCIMITFPVQC